MDGITIERIFNAPRQLVWDAWTKPEFIMKWWGPKKCTCPIADVDLRVGGKYLWAMAMPNGFMMFTTGEFLEVDPPSQLVLTHSLSDEKGNIVKSSHYGMPDSYPSDFVITILLEDNGAATKMTLHQAGLPAGDMSAPAVAGWNEAFDKIAALVEI